MKKLISSILLIVMSLTLVACHKEQKNVTLCDYMNLSVEKINYEVREEEIQEEINYTFSDYVDYKDVKKVKEGTFISIAYQAFVDSELVEEMTEEEGFEIQVGAEDMGAEFDQQLIGAKVGDSRTFTISYSADEHPYDMGEGKVSYTVDIISAYKEVLPEITKDMLQEVGGYTSIDELREDIVLLLQETYAYNSMFQLRESILEQVVQKSKVHKYSDKQYAEAKKEVEAEWLESFAMFEIYTIEEIYETFEMTEEDLEEEILAKLYRKIIIQAICEKEKLQLTDNEYEEGLAAYVIDWGYESEEELFADYSEDFIYNSLQDDKVADFLIEHATITERVALDSEYE